MVNLVSTPHRGAPAFTKIRRPASACGEAQQMVIVVCDYSREAYAFKAEEATAACHDFAAVLERSEHQNGFFVAMVECADRATFAAGADRACDIDSNLFGITPDSETDLVSALETTLEFLRSRLPLTGESASNQKPAVILLSSGLADNHKLPDEVATELRRVANVVTAVLGTNADEGVLRKIVTSPRHFYRCRNQRELESFLASLGGTLIWARAADKNAIHALEHLG
jgi:hypothetical protein